jgi:hypothetical protein
MYTHEPFYITVYKREIIFKIMTPNDSNVKVGGWKGTSNYINVSNNSEFLLTGLQNLFTSGKYFSSPIGYNKNTK